MNTSGRIVSNSGLKVKPETSSTSGSRVFARDDSKRSKCSKSEIGFPEGRPEGV